MKHSLESTIIRLMLLVRRVGAKMGGSLWLLQRILSSLLPADDIDVADEPVHLSDGITDADLAPLLAMLPGKKRYGSCLRDNDLSHKDDYERTITIWRSSSRHTMSSSISTIPCTPLPSTIMSSPSSAVCYVSTTKATRRQTHTCNPWNMLCAPKTIVPVCLR